jgi:hypothetical protein
VALTVMEKKIFKDLACLKGLSLPVRKYKEFRNLANKF